ncbi:MAG: PVC-type heme-binding CxxCH protein, partial [Prosthecobacter sp.]|nr:PVC-type heme-binding CxxCH protein [Prosthecobacter sp.]
MKRLLLAAVVLLTHLGIGQPTSSFAADPLRVFIRSGPKSHGPGAHDHPAFLRDWVPLLKERGCVVEGGDEFPTREQLEKTDVLILHRDEGGNIKIGEERKNLAAFLKRGGGIVSIHAANVSRDHDWFKTIIGGSWHFPQTKWREGPMHLYFTDHQNPITSGCSNFAMDDEIYYDMDVLPEVKVLAGAYTPKPSGARNDKANKRAEELTKGGKEVSVYDIQPQLWTYEKDAYRAFVCIPGHYYENFKRPNFRAILLRGIAWAGKRVNVDELCKPDELGDHLRYVEGGPTRPEKAAEKLEVHPEFNISLVAAEPLINKVMNIDWDEKGRLWVCETPEYPNGRRVPNVEPWKDSGSLLPYQQDRDPQDRISILTDTDGNGRMDKKHVFADKLELVTSFCFYKNGVIACSAPDIWFLEDTDGDEVADKRTKLYTGLGINDTHAVINNLRWGLDGWVYATHGYSAGDVIALGANAREEPVRISSGVIRFKPDGTQIEMYSSRGGNTWGLNITWDGQVFWTQPTSGTVFFHTVLPEYVLAKGKISGTNSWKGMMEHQKSYPLMKWPEQAYVQIDLVGEFTAAAGCAVYEGGAWPEKWNYSYFTGEPTINIVHHEFVTPNGPTYSSAKEPGREETEFIRSKDLWFRPIEERIGPDGALYVVDFYNQAVIHNDTRGPQHGPANAAVRPDRDHYFGRIWRLQHKDAKMLTVPVLDKKDIAGLAEVIKTSPNAHVKQNAWRLIREKTGEAGKDAAGIVNVGNMPDVGSKALRSYNATVELGTAEGTDFTAQILHQFVAARDDWTKSAIIAAASEKATEYIVASLKEESAQRLTELVAALLPRANDLASSSKLIEACADADAKSDGLKITILQGIAEHTGSPKGLTPTLVTALKKLLAQSATAGAALPLVTRWDKSGVLAGEVKA